MIDEAYVDFADADALLRALTACPEVALDAPGYGARGVELTGTVLREAGARVAPLVADATRGRARFRSTPLEDDPADDAASVADDA